MLLDTEHALFVQNLLFDHAPGNCSWTVISFAVVMDLDRYMVHFIGAWGEFRHNNALIPEKQTG